MKIKLAVAALCSAFLLLSSPLTAYAEVKLPEGAVEGLPEKLSVLDSEGGSPNEKGEYFFEVEDMEYGETYTKNIQITNLREDKAYHIYFYVEPVEKSGEIDLENEVDCTMTLDGTEVFKGSVFGKGNKDLTLEPLDLGYYTPGESNTLSCSVAWTGQDKKLFIDEGARLVDKNGMVIIRDKNGDTNIRGEITYKWKFYAVVDEEYDPPKTGMMSLEGTFWLWCIAISTLFMGFMIVLLICQKRKDRQKQ